MGKNAAIKFVSHSPRQTIENIIKAADLRFLKTVAPDEFERLLIEEVDQLAPYPVDERDEIKRYIHINRNTLFRFMQHTAEGHS